VRIGHGFDAHRFAGVGPIVLGGVQIPYDRGLLAHSDGDVLIHSLCDALLGAAALGDIGKHFPDTDPELTGVDSRHLLRRVVALLVKHGYGIVNADLTVALQEPRLAPYIDAMRECLASDLRADLLQVSVKATTTEGLGFTGRGEGVAAWAIVLLE